MCWSESGKNRVESTEKLVLFRKNWNESTENMNFPEREENCYESGKNMNVISVMSTENWHESCKDMSWTVENKTSEVEDLLIKGSGAPLLAPASDDDNCCNMAKDKLEKSNSCAEEEIKTEGINDDCREMAENRFEKEKSWFETAKNGFEKTKSWAEEKVRAAGISDEQRDLLVKVGGALAGTLATAAVEYYGGRACRSIFRGGSSNDVENLMKAPGQKGKFIKRDDFERNPREYFRILRGKHP